MILINCTVVNDVAYCTWKDDFDYYWLILNGEIYQGPNTDAYVNISVKSQYVTLQVIGSDDINFKWQDQILGYEIVSNRIVVTFRKKTGAEGYRVKVNASVDSGIIIDDGSATYKYTSSPITSSGLYTVDVEYKDKAGNWSSPGHLYKIHMYVVPAGTDFNVTASSGVLTVVEA